MVAAFEQLPLELFELIAADLDLPAYNAIRLSSRALHMLSSPKYAKEYFSQLTTTLGSASLNRLIEISRHPHFASTVEVLDVRLLTHRDYKTLIAIRRVGRFPPPKRFPPVTGVKLEHVKEESTLYDDISSAAYPKCITDRLVRILDAFLNLESVMFRTMRHDPHEWRVDGIPDKDQIFRSKCFQAVIEALGKSEVNLKQFLMGRKKRRTLALSKQASVSHTAFELPTPSLLALQHRFSNLESLGISIISAHNQNSRVPGWENGLSHLISTAPSTKRLILSLDRRNRVSHYGAAVIRSLALSCHLPDLQKLYLKNTATREEDLIKFVVAHGSSLTELMFSSVNLLEGAWVNIWMRLRDLPRLEYLHFSFIKDPGLHITARRGDKETLNIKFDTRKTGQAMSSLLTELINNGKIYNDEPEETSNHSLT